jgi:hypothetical protein
MAASPVVDSQENHTLYGWIEARIEMGGAGTGVNWPRVGHHSRDQVGARGGDATGSMWAYIIAIIE